ncbi:MAG: metallophosphoesterase [Bacteroidetes bacterium]|nr:metallophosphoesterase [Bacteroidota bacterium]
MKIGIIHFSDIHIETSENQNSVLKKKNKIVESLQNKLLGFDSLFLIITGDFAFSGQKSEYDIVSKFISEIVNSMQDYTTKIIPVIGIPGNHDCDFSGDQAVRELLIDSLESSNFAKLNENVIAQCSLPLENYYAFDKSILAIEADVIYEDKIFKVLNYKIGEYNIVFNCLNTAWLSKKNELEGKLNFPIHHYQPDLTQQKSSCTINLLHHPINWQSSTSHRELRSFLQKNGDINLSGHEHKNSIVKTQDSTDQTSFFIEASALQETGNKTNSSFNLIELDLALNEIEVNNFSYTDGEYVRHKELSRRPFLSEAKQSQSEFLVEKYFNSYIDSLNAQFLHKRADEILLDDLYVYPLLRTTREGTDKIDVVKFEKVISKKDLKRAIFIGEEISGKTTILKKLFRENHDRGFIPILINGKDVIKHTFDYVFNQLLRTAFEAQYQRNNHVKFDTIDKKKFVILIDDFHACELKDDLRNSFAQTLNEIVDRIFLTSSSRLFFNPVAKSEMPFSEYELFDLLELSYELRYEIIQKWNALNETELQGNALLRKNESYDRQVREFLGKNFLPQYPFIIITALQSLDLGNSSEQGAFKYYYKYLIEESLRKNVDNNDELQFYNLFLSEFCFFLFDSKIRSISSHDFENYFKQYISKKRVKVSFTESLRQLSAARIIKLDQDFVKISYNYIYYYYVALYFANNLERDSSLKVCLTKMIERLYVDEYSNIIVFLSQLTSSPKVIEELLAHTNEYFSEYIPSTLSDDISEIDKFMKSMPELVLPDSKIEVNRKLEIEKRSQEEEKEREIIQDYRSKDYDLDEDITNISLLNKFIRAIKTFEILGQVVKKNWGAFDGDDKEKYAEATFSLSMRILSAYFQLIVKNEGDLIEYIYYVAEKKEIGSKEELKKLAKMVVFNFAYMASHGLIKRVSNSISHSQLIETFDALVEKNQSNSYKLIKLAIVMDHIGNLPINDIEKLLKKDIGFNKYILPKVLLQNFVYQYLHLFDVPHDERSRICNLLEIKIPEQRVIQGGSIEKK